jgi:heptosyltransferase-3
MKIAFITSGSIGDAVISTSLIAYLEDTYPDAEFTIASGPASAPLFIQFPKLKRLLVVRKLKWDKHWFILWNELRKERWDLVVDLRSSLTSYILRTKQRKIFRGTDKSKPKIDQLAALFNLNPAPPTRVWVNEDTMRQVKPLLPDAPYIVMLPKSNAAFKDWPIERFAELAQRMLKLPLYENSKIVVLGLASQQASLASLIQALPASHIVDLSGKTDIPLACAILKGAQLVISNDSGLFHIAAALGTHSIGLYGPTNDKIYAPRGSHVHIIKVREFAIEEKEIKDPTIIEQLTVDKVMQVIENLPVNN